MRNSLLFHTSTGIALYSTGMKLQFLEEIQEVFFVPILSQLLDGVEYSTFPNGKNFVQILIYRNIC